MLTTFKIFTEKSRAASDSVEDNDIDKCNGERCGRGKCIKMQQVCDGVSHCEDGKDEDEPACEKKHRLCAKEPYNGGCGKYITNCICRVYVIHLQYF